MAIDWAKLERDKHQEAQAAFAQNFLPEECQILVNYLALSLPESPVYHAAKAAIYRAENEDVISRAFAYIRAHR